MNATDVIDATYAARRRATLDRIEARPTEWYQRTYALRFNGVARYCYASHAAILAGDPPDLVGSFTACTVSGSFIALVAREWLGLSERAACRLFDPRNTLDDLRRLVAEYAESRTVASTLVRQQRVSA